MIGPIAEESKDLNLRIGKAEVTPGKVEEDIRASGVKAEFSILTEGGLWVVMRNQ